MLHFDPTRPLALRPSSLPLAFALLLLSLFLLAFASHFPQKPPTKPPCTLRVDSQNIWHCDPSSSPNVPQPLHLLTPPQARLLGLPIDLNRASAPDLEPIPGLGPTKIPTILTLRDSLGGFCALSDLDPLPGFGPKTLSRLTPLLTTYPQTSPTRCNTNTHTNTQVTSHVTP
jgi:hypothetical protein